MHVQLSTYACLDRQNVAHCAQHSAYLYIFNLQYILKFYVCKYTASVSLIATYVSIYMYTCVWLYYSYRQPYNKDQIIQLPCQPTWDILISINISNCQNIKGQQCLLPHCVRIYYQNVIVPKKLWKMASPDFRVFFFNEWDQILIWLKAIYIDF